jgi:hypothetical protein
VVVHCSECRDRHYDITFCSFALHLISESRLVPFCHQLALITDWLVVVAPHKRPFIDSRMGFVIKYRFIHSWYSHTHHWYGFLFWISEIILFWRGFMWDSTHQFIVLQTQRIRTLNIHLQYQLKCWNRLQRIARISTKNETNCWGKAWLKKWNFVRADVKVFSGLSTPLQIHFNFSFYFFRSQGNRFG